MTKNVKSRNLVLLLCLVIRLCGLSDWLSLHGEKTGDYIGPEYRIRNMLRVKGHLLRAHRKSGKKNVVMTLHLTDPAGPPDVAE